MVRFSLKTTARGLHALRWTAACLVFLSAAFPGTARAALPPLNSYEQKLKDGWGIEKVLRRLQRDAREEEGRLRSDYLEAKKKMARARRDTGFGPQKTRGGLDAHFAEQLRELKLRAGAYAKHLEERSRADRPPAKKPTPPMPKPAAPTPPPATPMPPPSPAAVSSPAPSATAPAAAPSKPASPAAAAKPVAPTPPPPPVAKVPAAPPTEKAPVTPPAAEPVKPVPAPKPVPPAPLDPDWEEVSPPKPAKAPAAPVPPAPASTEPAAPPTAKLALPAEPPKAPPKPKPAAPAAPRAPAPALPPFAYASAAEEAPKFDFKDLKLKRFESRGFATEFLAYRTEHPRNTRRKRSTLYLEQTWRPSDTLRVAFSQRAAYDFAVRQRNRDREGLPETEKDSNESTWEWRDAYLDWSPGLFTVRLGSQQIVWGEAVGLFVADVVNARDFREMLLPETWLIRRPQWALDVVHNGGLFSQEVVVLLPRANRWPSVDSDFFFLPDEAGPLVRDVDLTAIPEARIPWRFNTLEVGGRLSMLTGGLDVAVFYLHSFEKDPVYFRIPTESNFTGDYEKRHPRQNYWGATFSKDVRDAIVKGELIARPRRYVAIDNPDDEDNVDRRTAYDAMAGVDYTFFDNWDTNLQLIDRYSPDASDDLIRVERNRLYVAGRISRKFLNSKLECEIIGLHHFGRGDELWRPKILYKSSDWVTIKVGADFFAGTDPEGIFSVYNDQDRIFTELSFHF